MQVQIYMRDSLFNFASSDIWELGPAMLCSMLCSTTTTILLEQQQQRPAANSKFEFAGLFWPQKLSGWEWNCSSTISGPIHRIRMKFRPNWASASTASTAAFEAGLEPHPSSASKVLYSIKRPPSPLPKNADSPSARCLTAAYCSTWLMMWRWRRNCTTSFFLLTTPGLCRHIPGHS